MDIIIQSDLFSYVKTSRIQIQSHSRTWRKWKKQIQIFFWSIFFRLYYGKAIEKGTFKGTRDLGEPALV